MSELPSYGTGWAESEVLMDTLTIYNEWNGEGSPDFSTVRRRLGEKFTYDELATLGAIVDALGQFIESERLRRIQETRKSAEASPAAG